MSSANYECLLHGIITTEEAKDSLLRQLVGMCGKDSQQDLFEHQIGFSPTVQTAVGPARNDDVLLRLHANIRNEKQKSLKHREWYLVLQGHPEPQRGRTVSVRPVTQAKVGGDALRFVRSLSYTFAFEFARQGFVFAYQDSVKISVTRLYKLSKRWDVSSMQAFHDNEHQWLVELTSIPVTQEQVNQMAEQLNKLRTLLSGIVELECVDNRALQNRIHRT
ncbi:unnamed protein product [Umbelopsis ramanniana]